MRRKINIDQQKLLIDNISKYKNNIWFTEYCSINKKVNVITNNDKKILKCIQVTLELKKEQKIIINKWLDTFIEMYNLTLKHIKQKFILIKDNNKSRKINKIIVNYFKIKNELKIIKQKLINKILNKKNKIPIHELDKAIKLACSNYLSAISNFNSGNFKKFHLRYWKQTKNIKIMEFEKTSITNGNICKTKLGKVNATYNGVKFELNNIKHDCKLIYKDNKYILSIPIDVKQKQIVNRDNLISIDLGVRTFITGLSEDHVYEIGDNCYEKIKQKLLNIHKINNNKNIPVKIQQKNEKKNYKKLQNLTNELHWKSISNLVKKYDTIIIGDMSVKKIVSNNNVNQMNDMVKQVLNKLNIFKYKQRLQYKCEEYNVKLKIVNEAYTSKICSCCGKLNKELGNNKIFKCKSCNIIIKRDINGSRGIYLKSL